MFIENKDFEELIVHYDRENAFFYLDLQYWESVQEVFGEQRIMASLKDC